MRKVVLVLILFFLAGCGTHAGTVASATATYPHWQVGQTVHTDTWGITIEQVAASQSLSQYAPPPAASSVYLIFTLTMHNLTNQPQYANPLRYEVRGLDGTSYPWKIGVDDAFDGNVADNGSAHGNMAFETPGSLHQLNLFYSEGQFLIIWDISV